MSRVGARHGPRFISPSVQREAIEAWAARNRFRLLEMFEELDESGARADRPLLERAIARIEAGASSGLVVWRVDRFGRSLSDGVRAIERIRAAGSGFYSVQDGLDISTEAGRLVLRILLSVAEFRLEGVRANWEIARRRAIERGVYVGSVTPIGYRKTRAGRLRPNPAAAPLITELYRRRADGASLRECCRYLESEGLRTAGKGNRGWSTATLSHMLRSRLYLGEVCCGRYVNANAHAPLIDPITWEAAQRPVTLRRHEPIPALLAGLVRCASCRHAMSPTTKRKKGGTAYLDYGCRKFFAAGACPAPAIISARKLEPYVIHIVFQLLRNRRDLPHTQLSSAEYRADAAAKALTRFRDNDATIEIIGRDGFRDGLAVRQERVRNANLVVADLRSRIAMHELPAIAEVEASWNSITAFEKNTIIGKTIDMVFVSAMHGTAQERVTICPRGTAPRPLPHRGDRSGVLAPIRPRRGWIQPVLR